MAEVISTIKIRNSDGTYSDELPIGTNSNYVTVDGSILSDVLDNLQDQINEIKNTLNILQTQIKELDSRLTALEDL